MSLYADRIKRAVELMMKYGMDAIILTKPANMFYSLW
jgi:Ca2+/H+ antiporter